MTSSRLRLGTTDYGKGVFAEAPFQPGERVIEFQGERVDQDQLPYPYESAEDRYLQIGPRTYIGPSGVLDDFVNHSCDPNTGLDYVGEQVFLKALRPIAAGEEITFDYSTSMDEDEWEILCCCHSSQCRGVIQDFKKIPQAVQERYLQLGIVPAFLIPKKS